MLFIFRPWQLSQTDGENATNVIILNFALRTHFTISIRPIDFRASGAYDSESLLGTKVDDWHHAFKAKIHVDLNGMRELYDYLKSFNLDNRAPESLFNILKECWDKILYAYHSYSKDARNDAEISDLKRKNEGASRRIAQLEQEYAQLMANNQSLSSSTVSLSDYKKLEERQLLNSDILTRKNLFMPQNRSVPDVREKRRNWKKHMSEKDIKHLVFLDESGVNINITRHYARAWKNQRAVDKTPLNTPCNTTVLSSIRLNGACAYTVYQGGTTAERFAEYLKTKLLPTLSKEDIIVMDNMRSHHAKAVKQLLDSSKVTYLYLPPYSPDLNPIEKMWLKLKAFLRKEKIRIASELPSAISKGFLTIRPKDCIGWFHSCDYVQ